MGRCEKPIKWEKEGKKRGGKRDGEKRGKRGTDYEIKIWNFGIGWDGVDHPLTEYYDGVIDSAAVWNKKLSSSEVAKLLWNTADKTGYHLTTKEYDPDIALYYFWARWYDPGIGRFISLDYFKEINRYNFCASNPIRYYDFDGNITIAVPILVGVGIGTIGIAAIKGYSICSNGIYHRKKCNESTELVKKFCFGESPETDEKCVLYMDQYYYFCGRRAGAEVVPIGGVVPGSSVTGPLPTSGHDIAADAIAKALEECCE